MKKVLITGASRGLGLALATAFIEKKYDVIAGARRPDMINLEGACKKVQLDVTKPEIIREVIEDLGDIDILINNAAMSVGGPAEAVPLDAVKQLFATNFFGSVNLMQAVIPGMRRKGGGLIVNISSSASQFAPPYGGFYSASKAALEMVSEEFHFELKHFGIDVMVMQCGAIDTGIADRQQQFKMPVYDELDQQMLTRFESYKKHNNRSAPQQVATAIVQAIEKPFHPFKTIIGTDAAYMLEMRGKMNDHQWETGSPLIKGLQW